MSLTEAQVLAEAQLLDDAERNRHQVRQTTSVHPDMTIDDAYRVQAAWLRLRLKRGESLIGHKIGLTSHAMQQAMNITTPDSGFLTDAMVFSPGQGPPAGDFCDPRIEVELAFVLGRDLAGEDLDTDDVLDATDYVTPAVELIAAPHLPHRPRHRAHPHRGGHHRRQRRRRRHHLRRAPGWGPRRWTSARSAPSPTATA